MIKWINIVPSGFLYTKKWKPLINLALTILAIEILSCLLQPIRGNNSLKLYKGLYFGNSYACDVKLYCGLNANKHHIAARESS